MFRKQDSGIGVLTDTGMSLFLSPLSEQSWVVCVYTYVYICLHLYLFILSVELLILKNHGVTITSAFAADTIGFILVFSFLIFVISFSDSKNWFPLSLYI